MENSKKCSNKKHSKIDAIGYCLDCNLYLCNKCKDYHSEYLENHHINNLDNQSQEIFTEFCKEPFHKMKLEYFCKTHNCLCCAACLSKIKKEGNGQHVDCTAYHIDEIKEEKKNNLTDNIQKLESSKDKIQTSVINLKKIYEEIKKDKEQMKQKLTSIFSKLRKLLNERETILLSDMDNVYNKAYFEEGLLNRGEILSVQIENFIEKGKLLNKIWVDDNDLIKRINDCINVENNVRDINEINENINRYNTTKINISVLPSKKEIVGLEEHIKNFGKIFYEEKCELFFKFLPAKNFDISEDGLIAVKQLRDGWNCIIFGDREIPKYRKSKWKIKINKNKSKNYNDFYIGIGSKLYSGKLYNECWSIYSNAKSKVQLQLKNENSSYDDHKEDIKEGDIVEVIVDRKEGTLSFALNDVNFGVACSNIPNEEVLYPTVVLYEKGLIVEIVQNISENENNSI